RAPRASGRLDVVPTSRSKSWQRHSASSHDTIDDIVPNADGRARSRSPSDAGAGWADAKADARAKLVQGSEFLKHGQFEEALARFQEAYQLVPSPKIQYNFGLAYRGLGRKADALEAFERFLADAPDASKETRQNAAREKAQLVGQITALEVKVDLAGAEVFV